MELDGFFKPFFKEQKLQATFLYLWILVLDPINAETSADGDSYCWANLSA